MLDAVFAVWRDYCDVFHKLYGTPNGKYHGVPDTRVEKYSASIQQDRPQVTYKSSERNTPYLRQERQSIIEH